jgi:hypothetical protein
MPVIGAGYVGDVPLENTLRFLFNTVDLVGAPVAFATATPTLAAYVNGGTTQLTAGLTLTQALDSVVGLHLVTAVLTAANGYATASDIDFTLESAATVDGVVVLGKKVGSCSIQNRSALRPTVPTRTLDVTATGAAGIDWANVENPTTALALTATTIAVVTLANAQGIQKNTALTGFQFPMYTTAGVLATGVTVTATRSINGAAFAACANAAAEIGVTGVFTINLAATDTNGDTLMFMFTAAGCVTTLIGPIKTRIA